MYYAYTKMRQYVCTHFHLIPIGLKPEVQEYNVQAAEYYVNQEYNKYCIEYIKNGENN